MRGDQTIEKGQNKIREDEMKMRNLMSRTDEIRLDDRQSAENETKLNDLKS